MKRHRRRHARAWSPLSAITEPAGGGLVNVVLVDSRGTKVQTLRRGLPRREAVRMIRERHP
jgi:hypothetical protein